VEAIRTRALAPPMPAPAKVFNRGAAGILEDLTGGSKHDLHVNREGEFGLREFIRGVLKRDTS